MKKLIFLPALLISIGIFAQTKVFCLTPACKQTIGQSDSVQIFAQLTASDGFQSIIWSQASGPAVTIPPATVYWQSNQQAMSLFTLRGLPPGTYTFMAFGTSVSGATGSTIDTIQVNTQATRHIVYVKTVYSDSTYIINY
jgi:hypothetical protein